MKRKVAFMVFLIAVFSLSMMGQANAAFINGDQLRIEWLYPDTSTVYQGPIDVVVGPGAEVNNLGSNGSIDIDASSTQPNIRIDFSDTGFFLATAFNGFRISDYTSTIADFTGVTINGITVLPGFDASRVAFTANTIDINFQGLNFTSGNVVGLDVASAVPEPSTLLLLGSGLVGLVVIGRRKFMK